MARATSIVNLLDFTLSAPANSGHFSQSSQSKYFLCTDTNTVTNNDTNIWKLLLFYPLGSFFCA